ncbi:FAD-dependent oxidoreductase [Leucobacter weissii]|uniref:FAD-dependent oxidoreductase n=1 Tax=Leucobacter weissii TaxID=1983706 RepID=A0A939MKT3_9MICO|nr:FAD-dependent oxidoreductase [Leucobacter weissii]MBO1902060.1 FAD-dependent oxidoreductase [Leucobacter weissii]
MAADTPAVPPRIAVIGGGVAGLVAAGELAEGGADVTLFEASSRLGGRIKRESIDGAGFDVGFDIGAEAFATRGGTVAAFLERIGLAERIVQPAPIGSWLAEGGSAVPLPAAGTLGIPARPLGADAIRALGLAAALRASAEPLLPRSCGAAAETLGELVRQRLGSGALDRLVRPVVLGVHSADPVALPLDRFPELTAEYERTGSLIAAARALRRHTTAAGGAVAGIEGGMSVLVEALEARLAAAGGDIRRGTPVARVRGSDDGSAGEAWRVHPEEYGDNVGGGLPFDAVLLATTERATRSLLGSAETGRETAVEVVALLVDAPGLDEHPRGTGVLVAKDPSRPETAQRAKALTHATAKWTWLARAAGAGRHLIRLSYGSLGRQPITRDLADDEVLDIALRDASELLGVELKRDSVLGMRRALWVFSAADPERSAAETDALEGIARGPIALAGDWVHGTGLASVIPGAVAAADELLAALQRSEVTA